jgi:transcriptional regulator GlxA family with amidase domain
LADSARLQPTPLMNHRLHHIQNWPERTHEAKWCAATLAKNCGVSLRTLERYFLKKMDISPKKWLMEQRQQQASKMLKDGLSIKETAANLDYKHPSHLTNGFKKQCGHCPTNKSIQIWAQSL